MASEVEKLIGLIRTANPRDYLPVKYVAQSAVPKTEYDKAFRKMKRELKQHLTTYIDSVVERLIEQDEDIESRHETNDEGAYEWSYNVKAVARNEFRQDLRHRYEQMKGEADE